MITINVEIHRGVSFGQPFDSETFACKYDVLKIVSVTGNQYGFSKKADQPENILLSITFEMREVNPFL